MADVLSLSRARKAKARTAEQAAAMENRARHGRTKAERAADAAARAQTDARLDGARREGDR